MPLQGRCNCGALSIAVAGAPSLIVLCHCTDCRRFTGAVAAYIVAFPIDAAQIAGHPAQWTTRAEAGGNATRFFCTKCGSSMYSHHDVCDPRVFMNGGHCVPGTLPPPTHEFWARSAEPWDTAYPDTRVFERQTARAVYPPRAAPAPTPGAGCNCGGIQVRLRGVGRTLICHCTACRRFTGSVAACLVTVARADLEIVGCPKLWSSVADSGNAVTRMFCGACGSSIGIMQDGKPTVELYGGILPPGSVPPPAAERFRHNAEAWAKTYPSVRPARNTVEALLNVA